LRLTKKIKGFTLIEMLVTLSLSTVVVAFAYMAYNYMFLSYIQYEKMNGTVAEFTNCQSQLLKLSNNAEQIEVKDKLLVFHLKNKEKVNVELNEKYILFYNEVMTIDTAKCIVTSFNFTLGKNKISNGFIDNITIDTEFNKMPYKLNFEKWYDAEKMIHLDSLNNFAGNGKY